MGINADDCSSMMVPSQKTMPSIVFSRVILYALALKKGVANSWDWYYYSNVGLNKFRRI
jgi:hypothetical protein